MNEEIKRLREWAQNILATPPQDRALMVAEDPSVLDVLERYIAALEKLAKIGACECGHVRASHMGASEAGRCCSGFCDCIRFIASTT